MGRLIDYLLGPPASPERLAMAGGGLHSDRYQGQGAVPKA